MDQTLLGWLTSLSSLLVLALLLHLSGADRDDIFVVGEAIRDGQGRQIGARGFGRYGA